MSHRTMTVHGPFSLDQRDPAENKAVIHDFFVPFSPVGTGFSHQAPTIGITSCTFWVQHLHPESITLPPRQ